ncbi:MAG: peptidylprolyl isomerase, partial [Planctomycetota bacterium]
GVERSLIVTVEGDEASDENSRPLRLVVLDASGEEELTGVDVEEGEVDLGEVLPKIWSIGREGKTIYLQLTRGIERIGSAVVLIPMVSHPPITDGLTARLRRAVTESPAAVEQLSRLSQRRLLLLKELISVGDPPERNVFSGFRTAMDRDLVLKTSMGEMRFALDESEAPETIRHISTLVEGGYYTDVVFHRVVRENETGHPFIIQSGDPTGTGFGGPGYMVDFESSEIPHRFGTISLARSPTDPNSGGSQFFVCLSREACASLDGRFASFGQLIHGAEILDRISAVPVGPADEDDPLSPLELPLTPVVIREAILVDAPAHGTGRDAAEADDVPAVVR